MLLLLLLLRMLLLLLLLRTILKPRGTQGPVKDPSRTPQGAAGVDTRGPSRNVRTSMKTFVLNKF